MIKERACLIYLLTFSKRSPSLAAQLNVNTHGISKPPWGKSLEYCLLPVTRQMMLPDSLKNNEQMDEIVLGRWLTTFESLTTATANQSSRLVGSLLHDNSPTTASQISLYLWYPLTTASTENDTSLHMVLNPG